MSTAIEFRNVSYTVPGSASGRRLLLDNISLALEEGTTTAVLGRSGSGKTTLLRTVNRMVEPTDGDVIVHGKNMRGGNLIALRRTMGYVIQETGLFPHFTVERNVGVVLEAEGRAARSGSGAATICCRLLALTRQASCIGIPISSRAGSVSVWDWRAHWPLSRRFC